jgi:hypothetical protein
MVKQTHTHTHTHTIPNECRMKLFTCSKLIHFSVNERQNGKGFCFINLVFSSQLFMHCSFLLLYNTYIRILMWFQLVEGVRCILAFRQNLPIAQKMFSNKLLFPCSSNKLLTFDFIVCRVTLFH